MSQRPYDWGDPPPPRIDWALLRWCLGYATVIVLLAYYGPGIVR